MLLFIVLFSCGQQEEEDLTEFEEINFFDIVYETTHYRSLGGDTWVGILGDFEVKFEVLTSVEEDELPDEVEGIFIYNFDAFARTSFDQKCSGTLAGGDDYNNDDEPDGKFTLTFTEDTTIGESIDTDENATWSVLDPYRSDEEDLDEESSVRIYNFTLEVGLRNFVPSNCFAAFNTFNLRVIRFTDGSLIIEDPSQGLEYFLIPKLRVER